MVNWDALGAIAELLGAVGVVVTLSYLALQIRRSNTLALAESLRFANSVAWPPVTSIAQDAGLAKVFRQGLGDRSSLNPDELVRFDMILGSLIGALSSSIIDQMTLGFYEGDSISDQRSNVRRFLSTPGGAAWWSIYGRGFPPRFQRFVADEALAHRPPSA
jgi:hypothetical protein